MSVAEIARHLEVPHATVRNYFNERLPATEILIKLANQTGVSLTWLLIEKGPERVKDLGGPTPGNLTELRARDERANQLSVEPAALEELKNLIAVDMAQMHEEIANDWRHRALRETDSELGASQSMLLRSFLSLPPEGRATLVRLAQEMERVERKAPSAIPVSTGSTDKRKLSG